MNMVSGGQRIYEPFDDKDDTEANVNGQTVVAAVGIGGPWPSNQIQNTYTAILDEFNFPFYRFPLYNVTWMGATATAYVRFALACVFCSR